MEYKQIKYLTIFSIIIGFVILIGIPISNIQQYGLQIVLFYTTILTIVVFMVYPILYLRSKNPKKTSKEIINIKEQEIPKIIYCPECGSEVDKEKIYCSNCGSKVKK